MGPGTTGPHFLPRIFLPMLGSSPRSPRLNFRRPRTEDGRKMAAEKFPSQRPEIVLPPIILPHGLVGGRRQNDPG